MPRFCSVSPICHLQRSPTPEDKQDVKTINDLPPPRRSKRKAAQEATAEGESRKRFKEEIIHLPAAPDKNGQYPNHNTTICNLPQEIIEEISSSLDPVALSCFSLTCKKVLFCVGKEAWPKCRVKSHTHEISTHATIVGPPIRRRRILVHLLARDAPRLRECRECMTLHPPLKPPSKCQHRAISCSKKSAIVNYMPRDNFGSGYTLHWEHVMKALRSLKDQIKGKLGFPIKFLQGDFTIRHKRLTYTLVSSGRQIKENLVLKHEHILRGLDLQSRLKVADIISLPVRVCPHQTTSTAKPARSMYYRRLPDGLLTHSITDAAPKSLRIGLPSVKLYNKPSPINKEQIDSVVLGVNTIWKCRACPTKWRVEYDGKGGRELKITAWHNLGDSAKHAKRNWKMLERRECDNYNRKSAHRNSEFYVIRKKWDDFAVDEVA